MPAIRHKHNQAPIRIVHLYGEPPSLRDHPLRATAKSAKHTATHLHPRQHPYHFGDAGYGGREGTSSSEDEARWFARRKKPVRSASNSNNPQGNAHGKALRANGGRQISNPISVGVGAMRAVVSRDSRFASTTLPRPIPGPGQLLVRVAAVGVSEIDSPTLQASLPPEAFQRPERGVVGHEGCGTVSALGPGVANFRVGDAVLLHSGKGGLLAEYVLFDAATAVRAPRGVSLYEAAALPSAGLAALRGIDSLRFMAGERVLVHPGDSATGLLAVQIAALRGARVVATATGRGATLARSLGADSVIEPHPEALLPVDKMLSVGGDTDMFPAVRPGGRIVSTSLSGPLPPGTFDAHLSGWRAVSVPAAMWVKFRRTSRALSKRNVSFELCRAEEDQGKVRKHLAHLAALVEARSLRVVLDATFEMEKWGQALERVEKGRAKGKVVVEIVRL